MGNIYLMSIKPKFAFEIFSGKKKYELRRWIGVPVSPGSIIVVYVSGSVRAIMGEFKVGRVIEGDAKYLWRQLMGIPNAGIDKDDWPYIRNARRALAIEVLDPVLYKHPVKLETLRSIFPGFNPPQSYWLLVEGDPVLELLIRILRRKSGLEK